MCVFGKRPHKGLTEGQWEQNTFSLVFCCLKGRGAPFMEVTLSPSLSLSLVLLGFFSSTSIKSKGSHLSNQVPPPVLSAVRAPNKSNALKNL